MSTPRSDELLFAAGGDVWEKYGTFVRRTLPEEERGAFSRSSDATFHDRSGNLRTAESGVLRPHWVSSEDSYSARLEAARTNELHNSESPATQTRNLTAGTYTLWMEGSGSVDASGATDGSYGTATKSTTNENDLTFTVSAQQDVTFTVNNSVDRFQCEEGAFRSSFIATQGSAVSRAADDLSFPISFGPQAMTAYLKFTGLSVSGGADRSNDLFNVGSGTSNVFLVSEDFLFVDNGSDNTKSGESLSKGDWGPGDVIEIRASLAADGSLEFEFNNLTDDTSGGPDTSSSVSGGPPSDWSEQVIHIGDRAGGSPGSRDYISGPIIAPGVHPIETMRSLAART